MFAPKWVPDPNFSRRVTPRWDYRGVSFFKDQGLRIDLIFLTQPLAARCTACTIDRNARKGQDASDHAPVIAQLADA